MLRDILYNLLVIFITSFCFEMFAYAEEIENREAFPDNTGRGVDIFYDLIDSDPEAFFEVKIRITEDGGETYMVPETVSGDIGIGVSPGKRKRIHWDTLQDIDELVSLEADIEIETRRLSADEIGSISIQGLPTEAEVFIDGINLGKTPIQLKEIPIGRHSLIISYKEHEDYFKEISIEGRKNIEIFYGLKPKFGLVSIEGFPEGAEVFLDDEKIGEAPITEEKVDIGNYAVKITSKGFEDYETTLKVTTMENTGFRFELNPIRHGFVSISGLPERAEVFLNEKKLGKAPIVNKAENIGNYTVKIINKGYENFKTTLVVKRGENSELTYNLISKSPTQILTKSLFIPGNGQRYAEYYKKGNFITVLQLITIAGVVAITRSASDAVSAYDESKNVYNIAYESWEIENTHSDMQKKYNVAKSASNLQLAAISAVIGVYMWNVIDALLISRKVEFESPESSINIIPYIDEEYSGISASIRF